MEMKKKTIHKGKPLSQEEVDTLSAGTEVVITWSGGNGPHIYTIHKREGDNSSYVKDHNPNAGWWDGEIDFVGPERPHTIVTLLK